MMNRILALSLAALGGLGLASNADASRYVPQGKTVPLSAASYDPTHMAYVTPGMSAYLPNCKTKTGKYAASSDFHAYTPRGYGLHASRYVPGRSLTIRYRSMNGQYAVKHDGVQWTNIGKRAVLVAQWCE